MKLIYGEELWPPATIKVLAPLVSCPAVSQTLKMTGPLPHRRNFESLRQRKLSRKNKNHLQKQSEDQNKIKKKNKLKSNKIEKKKVDNRYYCRSYFDFILIFFAFPQENNLFFWFPVPLSPDPAPWIWLLILLWLVFWYWVLAVDFCWYFEFWFYFDFIFMFVWFCFLGVDCSLIFLICFFGVDFFGL